MIVGNELYAPKPGEHVCTSCGRISISNVRYCQCGQAMLRKCTSRWCSNEIAIDDEVCEECGWPQSVPWDTPEGRQREIEMTVERVNKGSCGHLGRLQKVAPPEIGIPVLVAYAERLRAEGSVDDADSVYFVFIAEYGEAAFPTLVRHIVAHPDFISVQGLHRYGGCAIPALVGLLEKGEFKKPAAEAIQQLGPAASAAIPSLVELLKTDTFAEPALNALISIGPAVIPHLKPFTGIFKEATMKRKAEIVINSLK
jgi:hypothetical protein